MLKKLLGAVLCVILFFIFGQNAFAQEPEQESGFILEEDIESESKAELPKEGITPQFITALVLAPRDVEPAINFYIRSDITRKYSGLIDNLQLEKIYGILQEDKIASVYFDYSYTTLRNKEKVLFEKGKMTFIKFNSGRWFNAQLSIYLMDSYPVVTKQGPK